MGVDTAISDAQYGIDKLKANAEPFDFYLKGALASLKGILDYILEEYNSKYSVGIGENDDLNVGSFKDKVKDGKNPKADSFIDSYIVEKKNLLTDSKCEKLLGRHRSRDIAIHRKELRKNIGITLYESSSLSFHFEARDKDGNLTATGDSPVRSPTANPPPKVQYFLQDWPNDDIPTLCEYTLNALKGFVGTLRKNYP